MQIGISPAPPPKPIQPELNVLNSPPPEPESKQGETEKPETSKSQDDQAQRASNSEITDDMIPTIRKRVLTSNEYLSKRIENGYVPELPISPVEEAAYDQLALNAKTIIPDEGFLAECFYKQKENSNRQYVFCNMFFPREFSVGGWRYIHYIESVSSNVASSFQRGKSSSFWITSYLKCGNNKGKVEYMPACMFIYDKEFDTITPIYTMR